MERLRVVVGSDEVWNFSHPWYGGRYGHGYGRGRPTVGTSPQVASTS